jgi:hypothetical protein
MYNEGSHFAARLQIYFFNINDMMRPQLRAVEQKFTLRMMALTLMLTEMETILPTACIVKFQ